MLELEECLTITVQRITRGNLLSLSRIFIDIWETPTGFTGGNMRYCDDSTVKPLPLSPGDAFVIIIPTPTRRMLIVDDNLDFQVMTEEEYAVMKSMCGVL